MNHLLEILIAEDDPDDKFFVEQAFKMLEINNKLVFLENGEDVLKYLRREEEFSPLRGTPLPCLILMDLNMPKIDGREALLSIKNDDNLKHIPVVILTTSKVNDDILQSYQKGANSFITKPVNFNDLKKVIKDIDNYWFEIVNLPKIDEN